MGGRDALWVVATVAVLAVGLAARALFRRAGAQIESPAAAASAAERVLPRFAARNAVVGATERRRW